MTRNRPIAAALVALATLSIIPSGPAAAGSLSLSISPTNSQEARALRGAIALYALHRDIRSGASVQQVGRDHAAGLYQQGGGNRGIIRQRGRDHSANLSQTEGRNAQVILQFGRGARADISQTGGQAGILLQFGY